MRFPCCIYCVRVSVVSYVALALYYLFLTSPSFGTSERMSLVIVLFHALRKDAYSNILKILQPKKEKCSVKNSDIFHIPAQNIECGYSLEPHLRGGSNEYPQSMF